MSYDYAVNRRRFKNLFTSSVNLPTPTAPPTMPDPNSAAAQDARRTAAATAAAASGRSSTILTTAQNRGGSTGKVLGA